MPNKRVKRTAEKRRRVPFSLAMKRKDIYARQEAERN